VVIRFRHAASAAFWVITGPAVLGRVAFGIIDLDEGTAQIACWVTVARPGGGAAASAVIALSWWALDDLGLHRLDLQHAAANAASCRVAGKAGLRGTPRRAVLHAGGWHDLHLHARVAGDA